MTVTNKLFVSSLQEPHFERKPFVGIGGTLGTNAKQHSPSVYHSNHGSLFIRDAFYRPLFKIENRAIRWKLTMQDIEKQIRSEGITDYYVFRESSLSRVLEAIAKKEILENIDLNERMQNPDFRFATLIGARHSLQVSHTMAALLVNQADLLRKQASNERNPIQEAGVKKLKSNADEFAVTMFEVVDRIKREKNVSTYKDIVSELNKAKIDTYYTNKQNNGVRKEWHANTLQRLTKRWRELGLVPSQPLQR